MAASVKSEGPSLVVHEVTAPFETHGPNGVGGYQYDVSPDGQRILINTMPEQTMPSPITVVLNWSAGLKK